MSNSGDTTDNIRNYNNANHNELKGNEFKDSALHFGDNNFFQKSRSRNHDALKNIVEAEIDWDILSAELSVANQDEQRPTIALDENEPKYFWITKNIDFTQWKSDEKSQTLWLSGPDNYGMKEVSWHTIDDAKENAAQPYSSVLYFFCSTATTATGSIATVFIHTLLHQIVNSSPESAKLIAVTFLKCLLGKHDRRRRMSRFKEGDSPSTLLKNILEVPDEELVGALVQTIKAAEIQELLVIIDGIDITTKKAVLFVQIVYSFVKHMPNAIPKSKALLTSSQNSKLHNVLGSLPCIEYDKERKECLRFLKYDHTRYAKIVKEHHGSLEWFWNHPQYLKWSASKTSSLLYIEGKPGSGKSTLAKYFEKNLPEREPIARSSTVAHYFYTFRGTQLEATHENMLRSILYSILQQDESVFFHFQGEFRNFRRCNLLEWPYDSLKTVLSCFANHPPRKPLYIILDAMDESKEEDRYDVIQLLCRLCKTETSCVKVFLASRPVAELKHQVEESHNIIKLQDENKDDIKKFVDDFLPNLKLHSPFLSEAADYINANAEGVFVWVHLVKAELLRMRATGHNDTQIMDRLKHLPTELVNFYKLMLERLEEESSTQNIQHGITLFQLVLFGLRPMTVAEVQQVLAIPSDSEPSLQGFKENLIDEIERRIVHCGGNFVEITADNTVQLMHQTTREFLLQIRQEKPKFALSDEEAHIAIATASVRYLTLCFTNAEPTMRDALPEVKNWCPEDFLQYVRYLDEWLWINYALPHFKTHYTLCGQNKSVSQLVHAIIKRLNENQRTEFLGNWMAGHVGQTKFTGDFVRSMTSLIPLRHIDSRVSPDDFKYKVLDAAAALKLFRVVESLLPSCKQVDTRARRETPLILCARTGLEDASQVLVDSNEDLNAKNIVGRTALHYAAKNGHEAIVELLLKQGANKMAKDYFRLIAMQFAIKKL